jgi:hypothetical protein
MRKRLKFVHQDRTELIALLTAYNVAGEAITDYLCEHYPDHNASLVLLNSQWRSQPQGLQHER